jgi:predicted metal-dependent RNase
VSVSPLTGGASPPWTPIIGHCPGAVQFLFASPGSKAKRYVHTGDFRYTESMTRDPNLLEFVRADAVFLDTTYCNPKFTFPSQEDSVDYIVNAIKRVKEESSVSRQRVLCLIATYAVGKEKILLEVAQRCGCSIHVDSRKMKILTLLGFVAAKTWLLIARASLMGRMLLCYQQSLLLLNNRINR